MSDEIPTPAANQSGRIQVSKGNPTDEELGAVLAVLQSALAPREAGPDEDLGDRPRAGGWKSYWRVMRRPLVPGRDAWQHAW